MSKILERDVSGKCDDCDDLVKKGEKERQKEVEKSGVESLDEYPNAPGAKSRNAPPGSMGGRV
jgi:hypothetical protein